MSLHFSSFHGNKVSMWVAIFFKGKTSLTVRFLSTILSVCAVRKSSICLTSWKLLLKKSHIAQVSQITKQDKAKVKSGLSAWEGHMKCLVLYRHQGLFVRGFRHCLSSCWVLKTYPNIRRKTNGVKQRRYTASPLSRQVPGLLQVNMSS